MIYTRMFSVAFMVIMLMPYRVEAQCHNCIYWNIDSLLEYSDYNGTPSFDSNYAALSCVGIRTEKFMRVGSKMSGKIVAFFDKDSSWIKSSNDSLLLAHENGHFDIVEIYAREIRKKLTRSKIREKGLSNYVDDVFNDYVSRKNKIQALYDFETQHHLNNTEQIKWNNWIKKQLDELASYSDPLIEIKLK